MESVVAIREAYEQATRAISALERNCILEIRPGVGGQEAMLFADELWEMYQNFATSRRWAFNCVSGKVWKSAWEIRVFMPHTIEVSGNAPFRSLLFENGVHRVQRVPVTEAKGRLQTSAASVVVLPQVEERDYIIPPHELKFEVKKSTGPGGQSVNACHSAVRVTHIPSGMSVNVTQTSSQHDNKKIGLDLLRSRLCEREQEKKDKQTKLERRTTIGTGDRSEKVRTYNFPRDETVDHRLSHATLGAREVLYESGLEQLCETFTQQVLEEQITNDAIAWAGG